MKRIFFVLWFIFLFSMILFACSGGSSKSKTTHRIIHGVAAIGAFIEEGAQVQVRPASIDGINPEALIEGTVGANGSYVITIPESIPIIEETVTDEKSNTSKASGTLESGNGFIIRVWSASASSWVYSYAENNSSDVTANVNPYTDMMVKRFYYTGNNLSGYNAIDINTVFSSGKFSDGTPINVPTSELINNAMTVISKMLFRMYGIENIQNALTDTWQLDLGLDALLTAGGRSRMNEFLQYEFSNLYFDPYVITDGYAIQSEIGQPVICEFWTPYGNTGNVTMSYRDNTGLQTVTMEKQSDSVPGNNHFKGQSTNTGQCMSPTGGVYIMIEDYNGGMGFEIAIRRP